MFGAASRRMLLWLVWFVRKATTETQSLHGEEFQIRTPPKSRFGCGALPALRASRLTKLRQGAALLGGLGGYLAHFVKSRPDEIARLRKVHFQSNSQMLELQNQRHNRRCVFR